MSFAAITDWTFLRSLLLALLAWPVCWALERGLKGSQRQTLLMWLLAGPFLFPELLIGYLVAPFVMGRPWRAELACCAVLLLRSIPVGVIVLWGMPASDVSPAAMFVRRLKLQSLQDWRELAWCYWHGPVRRILPAFGLMFLITFQEFEAAALLGAKSWTDQLFTEYATGLSLAESGLFLIRPLVIQIAVLSLVGWSLWNRTAERLDSDIDLERPVGVLTRRISEIIAVAFFLIGVVGPMLLLSRELAGGWKWLLYQPSAGKKLAEEICTASLIGLVAGLAAWIVGRWLTTKSLLPRLGGEGGRRPDEGVVTDSHRWQKPPHPNPLPRSGGEGTGHGGWLAALCSLPGLCGGLTVSLTVLWITSHLFPRSLALTPIGWELALIIWLLPRSLLLQLWLLRESDPAARHLVALLRDSPLPQHVRVAKKWQWQWQVEPQIAAVGLLCYWAYLDLTSAALLAPAGMASVLVNLYNFMHFGHSAAMSMEAALVMFLPIALWGAMMAAARMMR